MLKIDYTSFNIEGVKEFVFSQQTDTFSIAGEYVNSTDINCIHLVYNELNTLLFFWNHVVGTIEICLLSTLIFRDSVDFKIFN